MKNIFTAFKEYKEFLENRPWTVIDTSFPADETVQPHYADTIEILLCDNLLGDIRIGGRHYNLQGRQVFYIPPEVVHSMNYKKSSGKLLNVKLEPQILKSFVNLPALLGVEGKTIDSIGFFSEEYERLYPYVVTLMSEDSDIYSCISSIVSIFGILRELSSGESVPEGSGGLKNSELCEIINWTKEHFKERITLLDIANYMGYSKYYFCNKFKSATGITYLGYLNSVRISHACSLLKRGHSVGEASELCGFSDVSYFVQLFKKVKGITPKQYVEAK
ncbi:MAG: AraC family transcriptional regulator [Bacillota bacterium]|nr:AraC family transcriptional regulator [Bacillota bacterium]